MNMNAPSGWSARPTNAKEWNVAHVFTWSDVAKSWLRTGEKVSVRPNQKAEDAFFMKTGQHLDNNEFLFFPTMGV